MTRSCSIGAALLAVLLVPLACRVSGTMVHLIPDGYVGPVVIVFNDPNGEILTKDEQGQQVYVIPKNGLLRVKSPEPEEGLYYRRYFYVSADGTRREIPPTTESQELQAFGNKDGSVTDYRSAKTIRWIAYVVGIPDDRRDWSHVLRQAIDRAIGELKASSDSER